MTHLIAISGGLAEELDFALILIVALTLCKGVNPRSINFVLRELTIGLRTLILFERGRRELTKGQEH